MSAGGRPKYRTRERERERAGVSKRRRAVHGTRRFDKPWMWHVSVFCANRTICPHRSPVRCKRCVDEGSPRPAAFSSRSDRRRPLNTLDSFIKTHKMKFQHSAAVLKRSCHCSTTGIGGGRQADGIFHFCSGSIQRDTSRRLDRKSKKEHLPLCSVSPNVISLSSHA